MSLATIKEPKDSGKKKKKWEGKNINTREKVCFGISIRTFYIDSSSLYRSFYSATTKPIWSKPNYIDNYPHGYLRKSDESKPHFSIWMIAIPVSCEKLQLMIPYFLKAHQLEFLVAIELAHTTQAPIHTNKSSQIRRKITKTWRKMSTHNTWKGELWTKPLPMDLLLYT